MIKEGVIEEGVIERFEVSVVTRADLPALVSLMERDSSPCYCRYWHFGGTNKEWEARCGLDPQTNRRELESAILEQRDDGRGLVARASPTSRIVGWMKLAPRRALTKLLARVPYRGLDAERPAREGEVRGAVDGEVLSIACFVVDPAMRRRGVARALVEGAIRLAPSLGASSLEAYPRVSEQPLHDGEAFMGPSALFVQLGFEVVREASQYPVLRRRV